MLKSSLFTCRWQTEVKERQLKKTKQTPLFPVQKKQNILNLMQALTTQKSSINMLKIN